MKIDEKYSFDNFEKAYLQERKELSDTSDKIHAKIISKDLQKKVNEVLHPVILEKLDEIVKELNSLGHNLKEYEKPMPGEISFRDDISENSDSYDCRLRLAVDTVVSVGFRDTIDGSDESIERELDAIAQELESDT